MNVIVDVYMYIAAKLGLRRKYNVYIFKNLKKESTDEED